MVLKFRRHIANLVVKSLLPLSIVGHSAFKDLFTFLKIRTAFVPVEVLIGMDAMNVSHTAEGLQKCLDKIANLTILTRWSLLDKVMMGTTDSPANIKAVMTALCRKHSFVKFPFAAHTIQLCVNGALADVEEANLVISKCQDLTHLKKQVGLFREVTENKQLETDPLQTPFFISRRHYYSMELTLCAPYSIKGNPLGVQLV
ncbi:hypothetical protein KI688_004395 [Linnemannia hyalina]|uniref:Uncharacterized protein n=1 Tax=Linnemannia hyalina TaxID=64524 RepID=A0A9P7XPU6_9FUNG|nr:hypothetical protein KI688_004395 [Linnemannia hyalina]